MTRPEASILTPLRFAPIRPWSSPDHEVPTKETPKAVSKPRSRSPKDRSNHANRSRPPKAVLSKKRIASWKRKPPRTPLTLAPHAEETEPLGRRIGPDRARMRVRAQP